ncbi:MAG: hypothetical protein ABSC93_31325, partial [Bryobacteraceae bacterium]
MPLSLVNVSWAGGGGDWGTATNWTPNGVPNNGANTYNVTINSGGQDSVYLDVSAAIASLALGGAAGGSASLTSSTGQTLTITGGFTINTNGELSLSNAGSNLTTGTFSSSGEVSIGSGTTLTMTNEPDGITDVVAGSHLSVAGAFNAGANNGLYKLNSVEGFLTLENGAATSITPGTGT